MLPVFQKRFVLLISLSITLLVVIVRNYPLHERTRADSPASRVGIHSEISNISIPNNKENRLVLAAEENTEDAVIDHLSSETSSREALTADEIALIEDPADAYRRLREMQKEMDPIAYSVSEQKIFLRWALSDPSAAEALLATLESPDSRESLLFSVVEAWSKINLERGFALIESSVMDTFPDDIYYASYNTLIKKYSEQDPLAAAEMLQYLDPDDPEHNLLMKKTVGFVTKQFSQQDYLGALHWVLSLEDDHGRNLALDQLMKNYQPQEAEAVLSKLISNQSRINAYALASALGQMAKSQPDTVAASLASLSPAQRHLSAKSLTKEWMQLDPEAAMRWVEAQEDPDVFQFSAQSVVHQLALSQPMRALTWAKLVEDKAVREEAIVNIIYSAQSDQLLNLKYALGEMSSNPGQLDQWQFQIDERLAFLSSQ